VTDRDLFLDTAARIGRRLAREAMWQDGTCAWRLPTGDPQPGHLYRGTGGMALFLAELAAATGNAEIRRAAEGAARHAVRWARSVGPAHPGLFNGRLGVAWAAAHVGARLGAEELLPEAPAGVRWTASVTPPAAADVVDGSAGVVLALLLLAPLAPDEPAARIAARWAGALVEHAVAEPWGWSWPDSSAPYVRNLLGYAHGASGAGHALLEAAAATGDAGFRYGAEQAFLYERRFYRPELGNWPDFRYPASDAGPPGRRAAVPYHPRFRIAWCHGATGIGLARVRAADLLGTPVYRDEALAAARSALRFERGPGFNFSLCHGAAGTVELLAAAASLGQPELRRRAEEMAAAGCEEFELSGRSWPCGTGTGETDPGLMLGEAGIGLMLLRMAGVDAPSVLLAQGAATARVPEEDGAVAAALAGRAAGEHFGAAMAAFRRLGRPPALPRPHGTAPVVHLAARALRSAVALEEDARARALLHDALAPELAADGFPPGTAPEPGRLRDAVVGQLRAAWRLGAVRVDDEPPLRAALGRLAAASAGDAPPAAIQARDAIARQLEAARTLLGAGDPLLAAVTAVSATSELEAALHAVHARPNFAEPLAAVHASGGPDARAAAFVSLLDAVERSFAPAEMLLPGVAASA